METFVVVLMISTVLAVLGKVVLVFREKPKSMQSEQGTFQHGPGGTRVTFGKRKPQGMR